MMETILLGLGYLAVFLCMAHALWFFHASVKESQSAGKDQEKKEKAYAKLMYAAVWFILCMHVVDNVNERRQRIETAQQQQETDS